MPGDDKETNDEKLAAAGPKVRSAIERVKEAAKADHARKSGRALALVPLTVAAVLLLLLMPRETLPEDVPLPLADGRVLRDVARADDARASAAEAARLPADILVVGTALRNLSGAEAHGADEVERIDARRQLDLALRSLGGRAGVTEDLAALRAVQARRFLQALAAWEKTGEVSDDFNDLAASFVVRAESAGWIVDRHVILDETERRVMFKLFWNVLAGVDTGSALNLTLDEQRALYAFYIEHPHPPESTRLTLDTDRRLATTAEACSRVNADVVRQSHLWLADKLKKLGEIDPSYPTAYALGVSYFRAGRAELAVEAFTSFLATHPDGAYSLLARNHLKALLTQSSSR